MDKTMIKKCIDIMLRREDEEKDNEGNIIPLIVRMRALKHHVVNYEREYGCTDTINLARGEIRKTVNSPDRWPDDTYIGRSFTGSYYNDEECTYREIYLGQGYFKLVSLVK